jgi:hypothetical protein
VKYYWEIREIMANNLKKAGWSLGWVPAIVSRGRIIWIADTDRHGKRYVVHAEEKLAAFVELEAQLAVKGMAF